MRVSQVTRLDLFVRPGTLLSIHGADCGASFAFKYNQWMMAKFRERGRETDARRELVTIG